MLSLAWKLLPNPLPLTNSTLPHSLAPGKPSWHLCAEFGVHHSCCSLLELDHTVRVCVSLLFPEIHHHILQCCLLKKAERERNITVLYKWPWEFTNVRLALSAVSKRGERQGTQVGNGRSRVGERELRSRNRAGLWRTEGEGQAPQIHSLPMRECKAEWLGVSCFPSLLPTVRGKKREWGWKAGRLLLLCSSLLLLRTVAPVLLGLAYRQVG